MLIISSGKLVADGTPDELRAREKGSRYRLLVETNGTTQDAIKAKLTGIKGVSRCDTAAGEDGALAFTLDAAGDEDLRKVLFRAAVDNKWTLLELHREAASLETVFRNLTTHEVSKS
jgi:ABC-type multidrug transport system ATPase subunit